MMHWISQSEWRDLDSSGTDAHRVVTCADGWVERFAEDCLISSTSHDAACRIQRSLEVLDSLTSWRPRRIFFRELVKNPGQSDVPVLLSGPSALDPLVRISELGVAAVVDFSAGYSVGWFCDQRNNRAHLLSLRPASVLNCFAYTGAFSLAAAGVGAETTSIDLSKKSLHRAKENFLLNGIGLQGHRFIADDVFAVLPRLARRSDLYDVVILDPPTFSRGEGGRVFRAEKHLGELLFAASRLVRAGGWILLSTNARGIDVAALRAIADDTMANPQCMEIPSPPEYPLGTASSTLWIRCGITPT